MQNLSCSIIMLNTIFTICTVIFWCRSGSRKHSIGTTGTRGSSITTESVFFTLLTTSLSHVVSGRARIWRGNISVVTKSLKVKISGEFILPTDYLIKRSNSRNVLPIWNWSFNETTKCRLKSSELFHHRPHSHNKTRYLRSLRPLKHPVRQ